MTWPTGKPKHAKYTGTYHRRSLQIVAAANADPHTRCWRCGKTLDQHPPHNTGRPPSWDCGHIGDPPDHAPQDIYNTWPLAAEASTCNRSEAGNEGARRANHTTPPINTSRDW